MSGDAVCRGDGCCVETERERQRIDSRAIYHYLSSWSCVQELIPGRRIYGLPPIFWYKPACVCGRSITENDRANLDLLIAGFWGGVWDITRS